MRTELNKRIQNLELPERMKRLKISDEGYPIPWFVPYVNNKADFRGMDGEKLGVAVRHHRCWLCGEQMGRFMTSTIGPMCMVTGTIGEPPAHLECAEYAVLACPFLSQPRMRRNEVDLPDGSYVGLALLRNPGVITLWTAKDYKVFQADGGILFKLGTPEHWESYSQGRLATREELIESIDSGMPLLQAEAIKEGHQAQVDLDKKYHKVMETVYAKYGRPEETPRQADIAC